MGSPEVWPEAANGNARDRARAAPVMRQDSLPSASWRRRGCRRAADFTPSFGSADVVRKLIAGEVAGVTFRRPRQHGCVLLGNEMVIDILVPFLQVSNVHKALTGTVGWQSTTARVCNARLNRRGAGDAEERRGGDRLLA